MAEPAGERAGAMFYGGARRATTALQQATRDARKALEAVGGGRSSPPPPIMDWLALDVKGWERQGMLSAFRMRGGGVLFTAARDVVKPDRRPRRRPNRCAVAGQPPGTGGAVAARPTLPGQADGRAGQ
eukprot:1047395-Pleurochrysis_carterae.AAC.1